MRSSADRLAVAVGRRSPRVFGGALLLLIAGCSFDLSLPDPPPPVSCFVRVTVGVNREGLADVSVSAVRTSDPAGNAASGTIPSDTKRIEGGSGLPRAVEFEFPLASTGLIHPGTWVFTIELKSVVPPGAAENPKTATCTADLRTEGVNRIGAMEPTSDPTTGPPMACDGDFVRFAGGHEVGIDEIQINPSQNLSVGSRPNISFTVRNDGPDPETFGVSIRTRLGTGAAVSCALPGKCWTQTVQDLPSGSIRLEPPPNPPRMSLDTSDLAPGAYMIEVAIEPAVAGDMSPQNDRRSIAFNLADGDEDGDGVLNLVDNCRTKPNPMQENCDARPAGNACDRPEIRSFMPNCQIPENAVVTVIGFGFTNIQAADITIGPTNAATVVRQSACQLEFTNPAGNANPAGTLRIATMPPVEAPLCCPVPRIDAFNPIEGTPGTVVTVLGCGFLGASVYLEPVPPGGMPGARITPGTGSTADTLRFTIPAGTPNNVDYFIHLAFDTQPPVDIKSAQTLKVK